MDSSSPQASGARLQDQESENQKKPAGAMSEVRLVFRQLGPWMTSFLAHLAVVILALFLVWFVVLENHEDHAIIPSARLSNHPGGLSKSPDVELRASQQQRQVEAADTAIQESVERLASNTQNQLSMLGVSGGGGGGKLAPFGITAGTGTGIGGRLFHSGGNAHDIIYVIDASGSLVDTMPFVIAELNDSIRSLSDKQRFNVIFFQAGAALEVPVPRKGWKKPDDDTRKAVADWISLSAGNVEPRGRTDPTDAIKLAMSYKPELVFLLSDNITGRGRYEINRAELLDFLKKSDPAGKVAINTIQFLSPDPLNTMHDIARQHNGSPKFVTEADLGLAAR